MPIHYKKNCTCRWNFHYSSWKRRYYDKPESNSGGSFACTQIICNFIFVHKLTMDLQCLVFFNPITCQFQDHKTVKMIGLAKEDNGPYLLALCIQLICSNLRSIKIMIVIVLHSFNKATFRVQLPSLRVECYRVYLFLVMYSFLVHIKSILSPTIDHP